MLTIKTPTDLYQLPANHSLYAPAKTLVERLIIPLTIPTIPITPTRKASSSFAKTAIRTVPLSQSGRMNLTPWRISPGRVS